MNVTGGHELPSVNAMEMNGVRSLFLLFQNRRQAKKKRSVRYQFKFLTNGFIQRTPMANRTAGQFGTPAGQPIWSSHSHQPQPQPQHGLQNPPPVRQPFVASDRSLHMSAASQHSNSTQEVEDLLGSQGRMQRKSNYQGGWASANQSQQRGKP